MATNNYEAVLRSDGTEEKMHITRLPFFDIVGEPVLKLSELPITTTSAIFTYSALPFTLQPNQTELLKNGHQLQLRMFQLDPEKEQCNQFPPGSDAKVDKNLVKLPIIIKKAEAYNFFSMQTRMKIPARSKTCSHLQCFDLENFLSLNEKTPTWKCPFCNGNAQYDILIIDQYFMDLLQSDKSINVEEIELLQNGEWKNFSVPDLDSTRENAEVIELDDDVEEVITLDDSNADNSIERTQRPQRNIATPSANVNNQEIITLDSSDDELVSSGDEDDDCVITSATVNNRPNVARNLDAAALALSMSALVLRMLNSQRPPRRNA